MDRRDFLKTSAGAAGLLLLSDWEKAYAMGMRDQQVGKALKKWKKGQLQVHFLYTGVGEGAFYIFPDGTTMLVDCGDQNTNSRIQRGLPVLPSAERHPGEWTARYIKRVSPNPDKIDFMMLSHYHCDHAGCATSNAGKIEENGKEMYLSGFGEVANYLGIGKAFDRFWPDYNDPKPLEDSFNNGAVEHMKKFFDFMTANRGLEVEPFEVGAVDQIGMIHNPSAGKNFHIRNICGRGRIARKDGTIEDLFKPELEKGWYDENAMSLGFILSYGDFKLFTAGDMSFFYYSESEEYMGPGEPDLARACEKVDVAKMSHHAYKSMFPELLATLRARVYVNCVWEELHCTPDSMERLGDRSIYPDDRVLCPCMLPPTKQRDCKDADWFKDVDSHSFEGSHVVLTVEKGGKDYSIAYVPAADESMRVSSVMHFKTSPKE